MRWTLRRFAPDVLTLADGHYNRQKPGTRQCAPPGRRLVMTAGDPARALWVSSWQRYPTHAWPGAWVCSTFKNDGAGLSSELIREAVAATRAAWGEPPSQGMLTFVDADKVRPKRDPGRCFLRAGFRRVGASGERGRLAFLLAAEDFPAAELALGAQLELLGRPEGDRVYPCPLETTSRVGGLRAF